MLPGAPVVPVAEACPRYGTAEARAAAGAAAPVPDSGSSGDDAGIFERSTVGRKSRPGSVCWLSRRV